MDIGLYSHKRAKTAVSGFLRFPAWKNTGNGQKGQEGRFLFEYDRFLTEKNRPDKTGRFFFYPSGRSGSGGTSGRKSAGMPVIFRYSFKRRFFRLSSVSFRYSLKAFRRSSRSCRSVRPFLMNVSTVGIFRMFGSAQKYRYKAQ